MSWVSHDSSQLHSSSYDPVEETLTVRFRCGSCAGKGKPEGSEFGCDKCGGKGHGDPYKYKGVPVEAYVAVRDAESVGAAFHQHIKKAGYEFERVKA